MVDEERRLDISHKFRSYNLSQDDVTRTKLAVREEVSYLFTRRVWRHAVVRSAYILILVVGKSFPWKNVKWWGDNRDFIWMV